MPLTIHISLVLWHHHQVQTPQPHVQTWLPHTGPSHLSCPAERTLLFSPFIPQHMLWKTPFSCVCLCYFLPIMPIYLNPTHSSDLLGGLLITFPAYFSWPQASIIYPNSLFIILFWHTILRLPLYNIFMLNSLRIKHIFIFLNFRAFKIHFVFLSLHESSTHFLLKNS